MSDGGPLIRQPIGVVVRTIVTEQLARWADACTRLERPDDAEAVHDFRVALRRLRSVLRAFRREIGGRVSRRVRADLRALADASSASRDLQVERRWVSDHLAALAGTAPEGAARLLAWLDGRQTAADATLTSSADRRFGAATTGLADGLGRLGEEEPLRRREREPGRRAIRRQLAIQTAVLRDALAAVRGAGSMDEMHRARIAAKRLRYLLEPFADEIPMAATVIDRLRGLQERLGDLHDRDRVKAVLLMGGTRSGPAIGPVLDLLLAAVGRESEQLFRRFEAEWLGGRGDPTIHLAESLLSFAAPGWPETHPKQPAAAQIA